VWPGTGSSASLVLDARAALGSGAGQRKRVTALTRSIVEAEEGALELDSSNPEVNFNFLNTQHFLFSRSTLPWLSTQSQDTFSLVYSKESF